MRSEASHCRSELGPCGAGYLTGSPGLWHRHRDVVDRAGLVLGHYESHLAGLPCLFWSGHLVCPAIASSDLVYAINDAGTIKTNLAVDSSDATADV